VEKALKNLSGIFQLDVNLEKHQALIEYDSESVTHETMSAALTNAGYTMGKAID
jgi:copper chaperone CopZ